MRSTLVASLIAALALAGCGGGPPVNRDAAVALQTEAHVDLVRYIGRWYEIARFPNSFEEGCQAVTATYSSNPDGTIKVVNRCRKGALDGPEEASEGTARIVDTATNAKLAVTFFWPFEGDYWVIGLADDYSWAMVGEPSGRYLWLLARTPQIPPDLKAALTAKAKALGYNTDALYWTPQPPA